MSKTTQERDYTGCNPNVIGREKDEEITRLRSENERLKSIEALVREYVSERDAPVQDIGYRAALLNRIREALQEPSNG